MKKFDELKYWLDLNEYIKTAIYLTGLSIAVLGLISWIPSFLISIVVLILAFILITAIMQLVLGLRQIGIDNKLRQEYKIKYQKQIDNLKKAKKKK